MILKRASAKAIRFACTYFHYAHSVPQVSYGYNVYNDSGEWCGCVCFGVGVNKAIGKSYGLLQSECYELVRVALNGKQKFTSEAVGKALKQLHKDSPKTKLIVSYADTKQGHLGIIYQATNWIYLGKRGQDGTVWLWGDKEIHNRSIYSQIKRSGSNNIKKLMVKEKTTEKHLYIYIFDKKLKKKWQEKGLPYPKKVM